MKYVGIIFVIALAVYGGFDVVTSVIGYKRSQVGYSQQQLAFMDGLVEEENK